MTDEDHRICKYGQHFRNWLSDERARFPLLVIFLIQDNAKYLLDTDVFFAFVDLDDSWDAFQKWFTQYGDLVKLVDGKMYILPKAESDRKLLVEKMQQDMDFVMKSYRAC